MLTLCLLHVVKTLIYLKPPSTLSRWEPVIQIFSKNITLTPLTFTSSTQNVRKTKFKRDLNWKPAEKKHHLQPETLTTVARFPNTGFPIRTRFCSIDPKFLGVDFFFCHSHSSFEPEHFHKSLMPFFNLRHNSVSACCSVWSCSLPVVCGWFFVCSTDPEPLI